MTKRGSIDIYLFEQKFLAFTKFIEDKSGLPFLSFAQNPYTEEQEGYKHDVYKTARERLSFRAWKTADIGSGRIVTSVISAIELPDNNLVTWQPRFGPESRPHQKLYEAQSGGGDLQGIEESLFELYCGSDEESTFASLAAVLGKKYPLLAYLFFIKDKSRFLPIAPTYFDQVFADLGLDFTTSHQCSWENYQQYLSVIKDLRAVLSARLRTAEVTLLDAHSFAWISASQMRTDQPQDDQSIPAEVKVQPHTDLLNSFEDVLEPGQTAFAVKTNGAGFSYSEGGDSSTGFWPIDPSKTFDTVIVFHSGENRVYSGRFSSLERAGNKYIIHFSKSRCVGTPAVNWTSFTRGKAPGYSRIFLASELAEAPVGVLRPSRQTKSIEVYERSSEIVDWVRQLAGQCESCGEVPFIGKDGQPFLEVHHVKPLSEGGSDTVHNTVALCPNCHRECHHGVNQAQKVDSLYRDVLRLQRE